MSNITVGNEKIFYFIVMKMAKQKAESEYEKYKDIQDKKFVSDFDKLLIEIEKIDNHQQ